MLWPPEKHPRDKKWMERLGWWSAAAFLLLAIMLTVGAWWLRHDVNAPDLMAITPSSQS